MYKLIINGKKFAAICISFTMVLAFTILSPASAQQLASQQNRSSIQREAEHGLPANCTAAAYMQGGGVVTLEDKTYTATKSDIIESVVCVKNGGWLTLISPKISKIGNKEKGDFGGQGVEASEGSVVNILDGEIYTDTLGGNGLWATNEGSLIFMRGGSITTLESSGHGVDTTKRASVILYDVKISTSGAIASGALVNDSGDGTVYATRVTANTKGYGSPGFYMIGSKSMLTIRDSTIVAETSDAGVLLYGADVTVTNSTLKGAKGVKVAGGSFTMTGGSLTATAGDAFNIVAGEDGPSGGPQGGAPGIGLGGGQPGGGMPAGPQDGAPGGGAPGGAAPGGSGLFGGAPGGDSTITLKEGVKIIASTGNIINVPANNKATFMADSMDLTGNIVVAETGTLNFTLNKSTMKGTVTGAAITMDKDSKWNVTGDSVLTILNNARGIAGSEITNIYGNGHTVYYDQKLDENKVLGGKTYALANGGKLTPK